jgi:NAD(P)H-dependent flavin oxidoreductase YrpB (nitropropane dioxygenase family)
MPARLAGTVATSLRYIAIGSDVLLPNGNATDGEVGETSTSADSRTPCGSRSGDERAHARRLVVVRVVVAGGQGVGADHDAALDLRAEALRTGGAFISSAVSASTRSPKSVPS